MYADQDKIPGNSRYSGFFPALTLLRRAAGRGDYLHFIVVLAGAVSQKAPKVPEDYGSMAIPYRKQSAVTVRPVREVLEVSRSLVDARAINTYFLEVRGGL